MANCLLRIGMLILISGQILLGYYRLTENKFLTQMLTDRANETMNENPLAPFMFPNNKATITGIDELFYIDTFVEFAVPVLLVFTGWRVWVVGSIIHLIATPSFLYNIFGSTKTEFQEIMTVMTFLQILGCLLYIFSVKKKVSIPNHP
mmetsp:Transcript_4854/g.5545  ORF Transcript_4854/g.5545 Transcript_4854/m.5545 type:complete len:148 (+) Transcript_4854:50-493(+)